MCKYVPQHPKFKCQLFLKGKLVDNLFLHTFVLRQLQVPSFVLVRTYRYTNTISEKFETNSAATKGCKTGWKKNTSDFFCQILWTKEWPQLFRNWETFETEQQGSILQHFRPTDCLFVGLSVCPLSTSCSWNLFAWLKPIWNLIRLPWLKKTFSSVSPSVRPSSFTAPWLTITSLDLVLSKLGERKEGKRRQGDNKNELNFQADTKKQCGNPSVCLHKLILWRKEKLKCDLWGFSRHAVILMSGKTSRW